MSLFANPFQLSARQLCLPIQQLLLLQVSSLGGFTSSSDPANGPLSELALSLVSIGEAAPWLQDLEQGWKSSKLLAFS